MSNTFKQCPTYFSRGGENLSRGDLPPWLRACPKPLQKGIRKFYEVAGHVWVDLKLVTNRLR